jgi:hypothetical protein
MNKVMFHWSVLIGCFYFTGCAGLPTKDVSKPAGGNGFGLIVYWSGALHPHRRIELHHWRNNKETLVWPSLTMKWVIKDNVDYALFFCWLNRGTSVDSPVAFELFGAENSSPPVNLTPEIIRESATGRANISALESRKFYVGEMEEKDGKFIFGVLGQGNKVVWVEKSKEQVLNMIREVKEKGELLKDPVFGTPYYQRN